MGLVIPFSEFRSYYAAIRDNVKLVKGAILDTNILISLTYTDGPRGKSLSS